METIAFAVFENERQIPGPVFARLLGAAEKWLENPDGREVRQIVPVVGTTVRIVPHSELREALSRITGEWK